MKQTASMRILLVALMVAGANAVCDAGQDGNGVDWAETADNTPAAEVAQVVGGSTCANWTRNCGAGVWDDAVAGACTVDCTAADPWDATSVGGTDTKPCADGFSGDRTRQCLDGDNDGTGAWEAEVTDNCLADCAATGDWDTATAAGQTHAAIACGAGFTGNQTRKCADAGTDWEEAVRTDCKADCAATGDWDTATAAGQTHAGIACPDGWDGQQTRKCADAGTDWEDADLSNCTDTVNCDVDDDCTTGATCADADGSFTCTCDEGFGDGKEGGQATGCTAGCAANGDWVDTAEGETAEVACGAGKTGNKTNACTGGAWAGEDVTGCADITCDCTGGTAATFAEGCVGDETQDRCETCTARVEWKAAVEDDTNTQEDETAAEQAGVAGFHKAAEDDATDVKEAWTCVPNVCTCWDPAVVNADDDDDQDGKTVAITSGTVEGGDVVWANGWADGNQTPATGWRCPADGDDACGPDPVMCEEQHECGAGWTIKTDLSVACVGETCADTDCCTEDEEDDGNNPDNDNQDDGGEADDTKKMVCTCKDDAEDTCEEAAKAAEDEAACTDAGGDWAEEKKETTDDDEEASAAVASAVVALISLLL